MLQSQLFLLIALPPSSPLSLSPRFPGSQKACAGAGAGVSPHLSPLPFLSLAAEPCLHTHASTRARILCVSPNENGQSSSPLSHLFNPCMIANRGSLMMIMRFSSPFPREMPRIRIRTIARASQVPDSGVPERFVDRWRRWCGLSLSHSVPYPPPYPPHVRRPMCMHDLLSLCMHGVAHLRPATATIAR